MHTFTNTSIDTDATIRELYLALAGRRRPEDVAAQISRILAPTLSASERRQLDGASRLGWYSAMPTDFDAVIGVDQSANALASLIGAHALVPGDGGDPAAVRDLLRQARLLIGMREGRTDFRLDRRMSAERDALGMTISKRRYNKVFRLVGHLESLTADLERKITIYELGRFAKTTFAAQIPFERFASDADSASFIAYLVANMGRRSLFTNGSQPRAFDSVSEMLLRRCEASGSTDWYAIAHVFPRADILARLTDDERFALLERTLEVLRSAAEVLRVAFVQNELDLDEMIVARGNDSSTWNAAAGAWNHGRDYWIALMSAVGHEGAFERFLPGKVMRVIAADVAYWHRVSGGGIHPDTHVWAALPKPWEVMSGDVACTREMVEAACRAAGVNAEKSGWTVARARTTAAPWVPTPETVHGVSVGHPELALWFRKIGVFSGKRIKPGPLAAFEQALEA